MRKTTYLPIYIYIYIVFDDIFSYIYLPTSFDGLFFFFLLSTFPSLSKNVNYTPEANPHLPLNPKCIPNSLSHHYHKLYFNLILMLQLKTILRYFYKLLFCQFSLILI